MVECSVLLALASFIQPLPIVGQALTVSNSQRTALTAVPHMHFPAGSSFEDQGARPDTPVSAAGSLTMLLTGS
jgi:hypothetical protein